MDNIKRSPAARWPEIAGEFATGVLPIVHPSFQLEPGQEVFTIGSCFARNIEAHLARLGCRIPMLGFSLPPEEWHGPPNQALNKFTPPSFRQSLEWTAAVRARGGKVQWQDCEALAFDCGDGGFFDLELTAQTPVGRERFLERRQQVYEVMSAAFSASCVVMTPGLIEGWRDRRTGLFTSSAVLKSKRVLAAGDRFELVVLDYNRCLDDLAASVDLIRLHNPDCKMLITTSPVPLAATFSGQDVRIANTYSKSVLRAACGAVADARPAMDYFPSYESVMLSHPEGVWDDDRIHVADAFVGRIVGRLAETYMSAVDPVLAHGQQAATALAAGDLESAERDAKAVLAKTPDSKDARLILIDVLLKRGEAQAARAAIEALPAEVQALGRVRMRLARAVYGEDRRQGAALGLKACAQDDAERDFFLWTNKALKGVKAPLEEREALLRTGMERFPQQPGLRVALADVLERSGRTAEAIAELQAASALPMPKAADRQMVHDQLARLTAAD